VAGGSRDLQIEIESKIPTGSGLGSSAAVSAATIMVVREYLRKPIENDELFELTMECEKLAHGNPSGIDASTVVYGGLIGFVKGKTVEKLQIKKPLKLLLVDSGKPSETTKEMVELVAENPNKDEIVQQIGEITESVKQKLLSGEEVGEQLNKNGLLLEELGVVGERAKKLSKELRDMGASVKITGAGGVKTGSGMMIVMNPDLTQIKKLLDNKQISYFETEIGGRQ
jgi:mevalonate kinase